MTDDLREYLAECARLRGLTQEEVLRHVLHLDDRSGFSAAVFPRSPRRILDLFERLDFEIRVRNPGFHYVRRSTYLGYRRESWSLKSPVGERSQVFVSVVTGRVSPIQVFLPLEPAEYLHVPQISDFGGMGHHGIGDLRFTISQTSDVDQFTKVFHGWLLPSVHHR